MVESLLPEEAVALAKEFLVGFGWYSGLMYGYEPVSEFLIEMIGHFPNNDLFYLAYIIFCYILPLVNIGIVYYYGRVLGFIALLLAFISGLYWESMSGFIVFLFVFSFGLGFLSFYLEEKLTLTKLIEVVTDFIDLFT